jgi:hypothetical protein
MRPIKRGEHSGGPAPTRWQLAGAALYIVGMCGRATYKLTWEEIVALYRLTLDQPPVNTRARYNVCPTTTIDTILDHDGKRRLERMRWGLIPSWWSKPLKEMKLATFNARAETVATKPMFRSAFKRNRCLIPVAGRKTALVLHRAGWLPCPDDRRPMGRMEGQGEWREAQDMHDDYYRAEHVCCPSARSDAGAARRE